MKSKQNNYFTNICGNIRTSMANTCHFEKCSMQSNKNMGSFVKFDNVRCVIVCESNSPIKNALVSFTFHNGQGVSLAFANVEKPTKSSSLVGIRELRNGIVANCSCVIHLHERNSVITDAQFPLLNPCN